MFADPRRSNWFVESCSVMASQVLLRGMSRVLGLPPYPDWVNHAPGFQQYAEARIREATQAVFDSDSLPHQAQLRNWLITVRDSLVQDPENRHRNRIIAEMLRPVFEESADNWDALRFLGQASTSPPTSLTDLDLNSEFEFDRWQEAVPDHLKDFVRRIRDVFGNRTRPSSGRRGRSSISPNG